MYEFFADALAYYYDYKYEKQYYDIVNNEVKLAVEEFINDINSGKICTDSVNQKFVKISLKSSELSSIGFFLISKI